MPRTRVNCFSISLDGYGAGPDQSIDHPLGVGGTALHQWFYPTATFQKMNGSDGGSTGRDDAFAARGAEHLGAWILGRNMFGPVRGPCPDDTWKGWWGETPPYHTPVFVLTHYPRDPLVMDGGTTFYFFTDGLLAALDAAREAAGELDVRIGGGVHVIRHYLRAGVIDEAHLVISPVLLGSGEHLLEGIDLRALGYDVTEHVTTPNAQHVVLRK